MESVVVPIVLGMIANPFVFVSLASGWLAGSPIPGSATVCVDVIDFVKVIAWPAGVGKALLAPVKAEIVASWSISPARAGGARAQHIPMIKKTMSRNLIEHLLVGCWGYLRVRDIIIA
jgi:hypothetical protein